MTIHQPLSGSTHQQRLLQTIAAHHAGDEWVLVLVLFSSLARGGDACSNLAVIFRVR
jgi:hypothetical protein